MNEHALKVLEYDRIKALVAKYAASALGKSVCEKMAPLSDREKIVATIAQTSEMKRVLAVHEHFPIAGLRDVRPHLKKMREQGHPLEPAEFRDIYDTLSNGATLKKFLGDLGDDYPKLTSLARNLIEFPDICNTVDFAIDRKGKVRDSASTKLADLRRRIAQIKTAVRQKIEALVASKNIRPHLQQDIYTIRDGRCVLLVKVERKYKIRGIIHDISQTGATAFIEPEALVEVGNELSDLLYEEKKEVSRILWDITFKIRDREKDIRRNIDVLAWIDFTYAKARFGQDYRTTPPEINDFGYLKIREARHPLLIELARRETEDADAVFDSVVPLNLHIGDDFDVLIVTGPNTGGKTVALKTVGLIAAMALTGLHIPAERGSEVPVFRDIYADIGDEQSIEQSLSTFSAHMSNIVKILRAADEHSLVLLDEMGSGTDPAEGAALSTSILDSLHKRRVRAIVTTHLGSLKSYAYSRPRAANASMEFDLKTLQPTYRMTVGLPGTSHAITIAQRLGMTPEIVEEARGLIKEGDTSATKLIDEIQSARMELERNREQVEELRRDLETLRDEEQEKIKELIAKREMLVTEAQYEIDAALRNLRDKIMPLVKQFHNAPKPHSQNAQKIARAVEEAVSSSPLAAKRREYILGLKKGQFIRVPKLKARCRVKRVDKKRKRVILYIGDMETEVGFEDITWSGQD